MNFEKRHWRLLFVIVLITAGCSRKHDTNSALTLTATNGLLMETLTVAGVATDSKGQVVARYDTNAKTMTFAVGGLSGKVLDTKDSISVRGPRVVDVKIGPLIRVRYRVTETNELRAIAVTDDGAGPTVPGATESTVGHIGGYEASTEGAAWLGVMLCALAVIEPPRAPLVLFDAKGQLVEQMSPDGVIQDHAGAVIARYEAGLLRGEGTLKAPSSDQTLEIRVMVQDSREVAVWPYDLQFGYRIRVDETNEVHAQRLQPGRYPEVTPFPGSVDEKLGRVEGYVPSSDGAHRLGAMLCVLSTVEPHDPEARLPLEKQPPPPPPPPQGSTRQIKRLRPWGNIQATSTRIARPGMVVRCRGRAWKHPRVFRDLG